MVRERDKEIEKLKERIAELEEPPHDYTPVWDKLRKIADELEEAENSGAPDGDEW